MAYVVDPHQSFSDRLSRILRQRQVPQKDCRLNDVWLGFVASCQAYEMWPMSRTAFRFTFTHEDSASGPVTVVRWSVYFEYVNRLGARSAISYTHLTLETPLVVAWRPTSASISSSEYPSLNAWLKAIQHSKGLVQIAKSDKRWNRSLSSGFVE